MAGQFCTRIVRQGRAFCGSESFEPFLGSGDAALRGLASWALARTGWTPSPAQAEALRADRAEFPLYLEGGLATCRVCDAAAAGDA